jgi:hypothetical protein
MMFLPVDAAAALRRYLFNPNGSDTGRRKRMVRILLLVLTVLLALSAARAADRKGTRFWNLTQHTIVTFQMSPAGQDTWGRDQCENDRDHEVDHDERLRITDIAPGRYDVRFRDKTGRICVVKNIEVKDGGIFSIEERDLSDCKG